MPRKQAKRGRGRPPGSTKYGSPVENVTVSVPADLLDRMRAAADETTEGNLSEWIAIAARRKLNRK